VDGLASPLHQPTANSRLPRGQGFPVRHHLVLSWWWSVMFVRGWEAGKLPRALLLAGGFVLFDTYPWNIV
jgi:hypothetical protein